MDLTKTQTEKGPSLAIARPVSRQYEGGYYFYYGWPRYWAAHGLSAYRRAGGPDGPKLLVRLKDRDHNREGCCADELVRSAPVGRLTVTAAGHERPSGHLGQIAYAVLRVWKVEGRVRLCIIFGNALVLVVFLGAPLDGVFFLHDADEAVYLPANAIASAAAAKEICRRGDHKRGLRRTADKTASGWQCEIDRNSRQSGLQVSRCRGKIGRHERLAGRASELCPVLSAAAAFPCDPVARFGAS